MKNRQGWNLLANHLLSFYSYTGLNLYYSLL